MSQNFNERRRQRSHGEGVITAVAVGGFLIILGLVLTLTPDIAQKSNLYFGDLKQVSFPYGSPGSTVSLLAPANPADHSGFYTAVMNFALGIGILQILILALRLNMHSPIRRIAETVGNLVFWLGAAVLVNVFLVAGTLSGWFQFWGALLVLIGVSLIVRFLILFAKK
jgi:hypothetical protein